MAKSFKNNVHNFMEKTEKKTSPEAPQPSEAAVIVQSSKSPVAKSKPVNKAPEASEKVKKKGGRPRRTFPVKHINIAVPEEDMEKINLAKACYGNDLTRYINTLIKKDLEENYAEYKAYNDTINKFNVF